MINNVYKLSEEERRLAKELGMARNNAKHESFRDKDRFKINTESSYAHILGISAEIAYAALTDQKINEEIYSLGDEMDFDGVEIKAATWPHKNIELKIPFAEYKKKNPRIYVLARIDKNYTTVEFIGSISRKTFDKLKYCKKHTQVNNWCVNENQMSKVLAFFKDGKYEQKEFNSKKIS